VQPINTLAFLFTLAFLLTGCSSSGPSDSLKIGSIFTDIVHYHPSFYGKWDVTPNSSIRFTVSVSISDTQGTDNLSDLYFHDKTNDRYFDMLGGPDNLTKEECYYPEFNIFECRYYSSIDINRVNLANWEVVVENKQGKVNRKDFEFLLPGGDQINDEHFVYSRVYNGSTNNGIAALEAMSTINNGLLFSSNPSLQSFHIEFDNTDNRATHYSFDFYNATANISYIAKTRPDSPSIESMPIIENQKTSIDIPWSEITLYDNNTINDINGLHIKLYDEPIEWLSDDLWFNFISYSEFLTLSP